MMESTSTSVTVDEGLERMVTTHVGSIPQITKQFGDIKIDGNGFTVVGDAYFSGPPPEPRARTGEVNKFGLCFGSAPRLGSDLFVGREAELEKMSQVLRPGQTKQQRLVLGGIGGIGKTQLAITYAERFQEWYNSVFWLNATSETTLNTDLRFVAGRFLRASELESLRDEQVLSRVHEWLADTKNTRWLLLFDNYDEPSQFDIRKYCPYTAHGAIIVTTRLPDSVRLSSEKMYIQSLANVGEGVELLCRRSERRNLQHDKDARSLVERLAGLPLALATAGAYLSKCPSMTFHEYLCAYNERWNIDPRRCFELQEYRDRTLYTTWDISYARLEVDDPQAAQLLKLLAYFDNQHIWYEQISAATTSLLTPPSRRLETTSRCEEPLTLLREVLGDRFEFNGAMMTLIRYCFVEAKSTAQSYSMHNCVHDWTLAALNKKPDKRLYWYACDCVATEVDDEDLLVLAELRFTLLAAHAARLAHPRFLSGGVFEDIQDYKATAMRKTLVLLAEQLRVTVAEAIYAQLLPRLENELGPNHIETMLMMNDYGSLYHQQGDLEKSEQINVELLARMKTTLGPNDIRILDTISNLGALYHEQAKLDKAEEMYTQALLGMVKKRGPNSVDALKITHRLAELYHEQGKFGKAEEMYTRTLTGTEKALGSEHVSTLAMVFARGKLCLHQGKLDEALKSFTRALVLREKTLGPEHHLTIQAVYYIGRVYYKQNKLQEAKEMYVRALAGREKTLGSKHISTLALKATIARLHHKQGNHDKADLLFQEVYFACKNIPATNNGLETMYLIHDIGILCEKRGQFLEAKSMYQRVLVGYEKWLRPEHSNILEAKNRLEELCILQRHREETKLALRQPIKPASNSTSRRNSY